MDKLKSKIKDEFVQFRKEIKLPEYVFWWIVRILMIIGSVDTLDSGDTGHLILQMVSNTIMLFLLPTFHIFSRKWCFFARLSYHNQTVATIMMLLATYLGNYQGFYDLIPAYDFWVHLFSGIVCVFVGYDLAKSLAPKSGHCFDITVSTIVGFGLSCFAAVFWEAYEFTFDCIMQSCTQGFGSDPEEILMLVWLPSAEQQPLFDTMTDLIAGLLGAVIGGIIFRIILEAGKRKKAVPEYDFTEKAVL